MPTLGAAGRGWGLVGRGFTATADLQAWQSHEFTRGTGTLRITSVPGVHGPGPLARVLPQVPHLGGTRALGLTATMDARQGADLVELLKPPVTVPVHYDDYDRFRSPLGDFLAEVGRRELPGERRTVQRGETISLRREPG